MAERVESFHPVDTLGNTASSGGQGLAFGAVLAGAQNALRRQNVGAMGIFTHSGHVIALYGGVAAAYQFSKDASANLRQKQDNYNEAIGGAMGGLVFGLTRRSVPWMVTSAVGFGTIMAAFGYTKGLRGYRYDLTDEDEVEKREALKKARRRPLQETIEELGEGRGLYAPGYEERRRERLLAKYGVDVAEAQGAK